MKIGSAARIARIAYFMHTAGVTESLKIQKWSSANLQKIAEDGSGITENVQGYPQMKICQVCETEKSLFVEVLLINFSVK